MGRPNEHASEDACEHAKERKNGRTGQREIVLVGLIGAGIGGSLSPAMHEEEGSRLGLHYVYRRIDLEALKLDVSALPELLLAAERMGFNGLNITYPCKQAVIALLDELSDDARALGAVNTVLFKDGKRIGHNTDWSGFARAFQRGLPDVSLQRVVQLGAGGAGAAVAHAALAMGAQTLTLFDVDAARAAALAAELQKRFADRTVIAGASTDAALGATLAAANGLIHATPTGMAKLPGLPLPAQLLHRDLWVADIVYFPIRTALLQAAEALGCRTLSGGGMAVYQAVDAMRIFTGLEPDAERVYTHFQSLLER
ncbi:MAG: Quinate/shikimate 5-dehydrogenase I delta (EC [uncultured Paraburkholderia sp.]|nr:MAG: Quinate/shikimate 5-dehydrogenase I delta (EC [uncultured Paraburkholderia sp.]CAH2796183.1 MAG: Quinate/shikimate 5-dehydrogenase I delta (EC [uncultured Paraburkholderia sp.]CAH2930533.1 MAG: Quinate/shikimate 5-dehydrogenase I delta (EC [uncultured Paraburkholderia sp.]CAH2931687.1 MAG: Quinate/shikimate 5-dehydrogenase I delta (EC [uncultured Paraburkholderia sp.]